MSDTDPRAGFVAALRDIADHFEARPDLKLPINPRLGIVSVDAEGFAEQIRQLGGKRDKKPLDTIMRVQRYFGPVQVEVIAMRDDVCTKRVVGVETVMEPAPGAPMVEVEREVVEWECPPVLGGSVSADVLAAEAVDDAVDTATETRHTGLGVS